MKIVILQTDIVWANPSVNIQKADEIINKYEGVDIFVLPEMFSTGFCTSGRNSGEIRFKNFGMDEAYRAT